MKEKYTYILTEMLEISVKGDFEKTGEITFDPPGMSIHREISRFEQLFMGSIVSAGDLFSVGKGDVAEEEEKSALQTLKDKTPSAEELRMMFTLSQKVDIYDLSIAFKKIALKTGYVDEGLKIKESHFDKIERDDFMAMMCGYASFFIFPSLLGGQLEKKNGSQSPVT